MTTITSADGMATVHISDAREMQLEHGSVKLLLGASVFLGKGVPWTDYEELYQRVYLELGVPALAPSGCLLVIQTDAYQDGKVLPKNTFLPTQLLQHRWQEEDGNLGRLELVDRKVWRRRKADHFQVPFSEVFVFRRQGGSVSRRNLAKHNAYFQGIWDYPQSKGGPLAAYPDIMCRMLVEAFTDPGDMIVDPFCGTARLLGVAAGMGRHAVGYEINSAMIPTIKENLL